MVNKLSLLLPDKLGRFYNAVDILVLLLAPAFLCLAIPDWIFAPSSFIDSYVYLGYFRNFSQHVMAFGDTYYGTRLPFIIPGYICYNIFPPLVANYVLHLGFYYMAIFSLYFIVRITVNRRAALLAALFMGFYPYFLAATGWDYVDGAGIGYFLLTVLLLTLVARSPRVNQPENQNHYSSARLSKKGGLLLFLAGTSVAAMIYTNTFLFIMAPSLVLYYLVLTQPRSWNLLLKSGLVVVYSVILTTLLLGAVNVAAGGSFLFFIPSILVAGSLLIGSNPWLITGYTWLLQVPFMVFPSFIFLTSFLSIIVSLVRVKSSLFTINSLLQVARANIFSLCHLLNFLFMLILQLLGKPSFQLQYYASYLMPTAFLAAGAQLSAPLSRLSRSRYTVLATITIFLLAGAYLIYCYSPFHELMNRADSVWYVFAMLVFGALCLSIAGKSRGTANTLIVGIAVLFFTSANITILPTDANVKLPICYSPFIRLPMSYCTCKQQQLNYPAVIKSDDAIRTYDTTGNLRFWYNVAEPLGDLYLSIASTRLWAYRLINDRFPEIVEPDYPFCEHKSANVQIPPGTVIVILSDDKDAFLKANASLGLLGLQAKLIGTEQITQGPVSFTMTFIRAEAN